MRVFLIAGEPSGDALGRALMAGLKALVPEVAFQGVGGPLMEGEGMTSLFPMDELSVMGLAEILPRYPALKRRLNQTIAAVLEAKPDVLVTIDSPDFCLRVDMPAIGPGTVEAAARAGLAGIVIAAGQVLLIDRPGIVAAAEAAGLFVLARAV